MDEELFKLCKQVYEATKFETGEWFEITENLTVTNEDKYIMEQDTVDTPYDFIPRYTSDYLLEILPNQLHKDGFIYYLTLSAKFGDEFKANYVTPTGLLYLFCEPEDSTPLETLLQLVIALDDAGVEL